MTTAVAFEHTLSLSNSILRPSIPNAEAPSMSDSLPDINFGFDELRDRMARFTVKFDAFIEQGRKRVLEENNAFRANLSEIHGRHPQTFHVSSTELYGADDADHLLENLKAREADIEIQHAKAQTHASTLAREAHELAELEGAIAELQDTRDTRQEQRDALAEAVSQMTATVAARRQARAAQARALDAQARWNEPELEFWVTYLGLRIEGAGGEDRLRFVFVCVDERDWEREAWFELDMREREYRVLGWEPRAEGEKREAEEERVRKCLMRLNETRELAGFLKGMREVFVDGLKKT